MTQSISQCVVSWARWGPLGRIGTYWSQAPGVNTFRKYYELFVLCAAVSGCQIYYVIASSGAWRKRQQQIVCMGAPPLRRGCACRKLAPKKLVPMIGSGYGQIVIRFLLAVRSKTPGCAIGQQHLLQMFRCQISQTA